MKIDELRAKTKDLYAPAFYGDQPCRYHDASDELLLSVTGGCGPGGVGDFLVPDTIWGLNIKPSCSIHDFLYAFGVTQEDKDLADLVFLDNMIRQVEAGAWWLKVPRRHRAVMYYGKVKDFGGSAFWKDKVKP